MKQKVKVIFAVVFVLIIALSSTAVAQYAGGGFATVFQISNMGDQPANINVDFYDASGTLVSGATKTYSGVPVNGSKTVVQITDATLPSGSYSAVISSDQPLAGIVNQEFYSSGSISPQPPVSAYSAFQAGSNTVYNPSIMYNYYGFYTELYIMNVGNGDASVRIDYYPGKDGTLDMGASGIFETFSVKQYQSVKKSQQSMANLGAPAGNGQYVGKFFGSAKVTANQPLAVVVNEHQPSNYRLLTYNGFGETSLSAEVAVPTIMRNFYGYYTSTTILNTSSTDKACVEVTYTANSASAPASGTVTNRFVIDPLKSKIRYEGPGSVAPTSDLAGTVFARFQGSAKFTSLNTGTVDGVTCPAVAAPIVVMVNVESNPAGDDQAGSYNGFVVSQGTTTVVVPLVMADFYNFYTVLNVQNLEDKIGSCSVSYTSGDATSGAATPNATKPYTHPLTANGSFVVYEGRKGGIETGDINHDTFWRSGANKRFIGSATIVCDVKVVAYVNEEQDILYRDSMYTYNAINK